MMYALCIITALFLAWYFFYLEGKRNAWRNAPDQPIQADPHNNQGVSVIIAFRNEEKNLPPLINDLLQQSHSVFELILVDDHSTDGGCDYLRSLTDHRIRLFHLESTKGKKAALALGVSQATYPLLLFTDADCRMGVDWISAMLSPFDQGHVQLVCGPVTFSGQDSLFREWMKLEFAALVAVGAASVYQNKPGMSNGANMACRRGTWEETFLRRKDVQIDSGDDVFLLHETFRLYPNGVVFMRNADAMVYTPAPEGLREFIHQRIRWAGKSKRYSNRRLQAEAFAIFLVHALVLLCLFFALFIPQMQWSGIAFFGLKCVADLRFFLVVLPFFKAKAWLRFFFIKALIQLFYVVLLGFLAMFGSSTWKGRKVRI